MEDLQSELKLVKAVKLKFFRNGTREKRRPLHFAVTGFDWPSFLSTAANTKETATSLPSLLVFLLSVWQV
jgi:hypothetical protein